MIAVECVGRPKEFMAGKQLVKSGQQIPAASLADENVAPAELIAGL